MITENDVIRALAEYLRRDNWRILATSGTGQTGHDVLAEANGVTLVIEAKGGTSSKPDTKRYGKPFTRNQKLSHIAKAFYTAATVVSAGQHRAAIALPSDDEHRELVNDIAPALESLGIGVFFVADDLTVFALWGLGIKAASKPVVAKAPDRHKDGAMPDENVAREIRNKSKRSFRNLRAAARRLQDLPHDEFGTPKVRDASVSCVRKIKRETRMTLVEIEQWANDSMRG